VPLQPSSTVQRHADPALIRNQPLPAVRRLLVFGLGFGRRRVVRVTAVLVAVRRRRPRAWRRLRLANSGRLLGALLLGPGAGAALLRGALVVLLLLLACSLGGLLLLLARR
jgi:hypothetical protein